MITAFTAHSYGVFGVFFWLKSNAEQISTDILTTVENKPIILYFVCVQSTREGYS